jgi:hypothetical protein
VRAKLNDPDTGAVPYEIGLRLGIFVATASYEQA